MAQPASPSSGESPAPSTSATVGSDAGLAETTTTATTAAPALPRRTNPSALPDSTPRTRNRADPRKRDSLWLWPPVIFGAMALASWRLDSFGVLVIGVLAVSGIALLIGGGSFSGEMKLGIVVTAVAALTLIFLGRNTGAIRSAPEPTMHPSPSSVASADPVLVQRLRQGTSGGIDITGVVLDGQDLRKASVPGLRARAASLAGVRFEGSSLPGSDLAGGDLNGAHLQGANLRGVNLAGADLRDADFTGACLNGADLSGALVDRASFKGAAVEGVTVDQKAIRNAEDWATTDAAGNLACLL